MLVSIVEEERRGRRGPDRTRAQRGSGIGLPPRRRPGWRACVSPLMRAHVSGPPADVVVFMNTGTKVARASASPQAPVPHRDIQLESEESRTGAATELTSVSIPRGPPPRIPNSRPIVCSSSSPSWQLLTSQLGRPLLVLASEGSGDEEPEYGQRHVERSERR